MSESSESSESSDDDVFEVDKIVGIKTTRGGEMLYRVRWKNYTAADDTWEPHGNLTAGCDELIDEYLKSQQTPQRKKPQKRGQKGSKNKTDSQKSTAGRDLEAERSLPVSEQSKPSASGITSVASSSPITLSDSTTSIANQVEDVSRKLEHEVIVISSSESQENKPAEVSSSLDEVGRDNGPFADVTTAATTTAASAAAVRTTAAATSNASSAVAKEPDESQPDAETQELDVEEQATILPVEAKNILDISEEVTSTAAEEAKEAEAPKPIEKSPGVGELSPEPCDHSAELGLDCVQRYLAATEEMTITDNGESKEIRNCVISIIGQLDDPTSKIEPFELLMKLKCCLEKHKSRVHSLIAAIVVQSEDDFLIEKEQWISQVDKSLPGRWTPLHFASALNKFMICDWLLGQGVWPDIQSQHRLETPLSLALQHPMAQHDPVGLQPFIKQLIHHGANIIQKDFQNKKVSYIFKADQNMAATSLLFSEHQQLKLSTHTLLQSYLPPEYSVYMHHMFLEPRIITVPPGIAYKVNFAFKPPSIPCVARIAFPVYERSEASTEPPRRQELVKLWPLSSLMLNGVDIAPADKKFLTVTVKSELKPGANSLELTTSSDFMDSVLLVGYYITKKSLKLQVKPA